MKVTVKNSHRTMGQNNYTYEGELVATPKWVEYDAIALTTGENSKFKFRIIPKSDIVSIDGTEYKKQEIKSDIRTYSVAGSKGNVYTVTVGEKYRSCTCVAFTYRRSCKHIVEVE